jgi:metal-responsive CopG/Arc/MetJ family transcriptional regulator
VNFSIHLPDPLLADLDAFAQTRQTSRNGVIREAVREFWRVEGLAVNDWLARGITPDGQTR